MLFRQHLSLPFDAIERCVPVWASRSPTADESRGSGDLRDFFKRIDGRTDLASLFAPVPLEERARRMDRLVLRCREGALALCRCPARRRTSRRAPTGSRRPGLVASARAGARGLLSRDRTRR